MLDGVQGLGNDNGDFKGKYPLRSLTKRGAYLRTGHLAPRTSARLYSTMTTCRS